MQWYKQLSTCSLVFEVIIFLLYGKGFRGVWNPYLWGLGPGVSEPGTAMAEHLIMYIWGMGYTTDAFWGPMPRIYSHTPVYTPV